MRFAARRRCVRRRRRRPLVGSVALGDSDVASSDGGVALGDGCGNATLGDKSSTLSRGRVTQAWAAAEAAAAMPCPWRNA